MIILRLTKKRRSSIDLNIQDSKVFSSVYILKIYKKRRSSTDLDSKVFSSKLFFFAKKEIKLLFFVKMMEKDEERKQSEDNLLSRLSGQ